MTDAAEPAQAPAPADAPPALTEDQVSGRLFVRWNAAAAVLGLVAVGVGLALAPGSSAPAIAAFDPVKFAADPRWDDGRAELARYAATRTLYGRPQEYELVRIAVKEPYDRATRVKPDAATRDTVTAFKLVAEHTTPTARLYTYHQQTIVRVARADPRVLLDATLSSHEWCGNTFQVLHRRGGAVGRTVHSYWAGEGDRSDRLPAGFWLEDQLPFTLRSLPLQAGDRYEVSLLPTLLANRAPATRPEPAVIEVGAAEPVDAPAGRFSCAPVVVTRQGEEVGRYWIGLEGARPLVRYRDGTGEGVLRSLERVAYWQDPK